MSTLHRVLTRYLIQVHCLSINNLRDIEYPHKMCYKKWNISIIKFGSLCIVWAYYVKSDELGHKIFTSSCHYESCTACPASLTAYLTCAGRQCLPCMHMWCTCKISKLTNGNKVLEEYTLPHYSHWSIA